MSELQVNRRNTLAFILADPIPLVLESTARVSDGKGGTKPAPGPTSKKPEQVFRLIPQTDIMPSVQTPDGVTLTPSYVLLGTHDCLMDRWDTFRLNGVLFRLVSPVRPDFTIFNVYERKADVARV